MGLGWVRPIWVLAVVCASVAGCSQSDSGPSVVTLAETSAVDADLPSGPVANPGTSVPASSAPGSPTDGATTAQTQLAAIEEEVLGDRVRGYFAARAAANAGPSPDPTDPGLGEFAAGEEFGAVVRNTAERRDAGQAIRPGDADLSDVRVGFVMFDAASASVSACSVDDGVIFDVATGAVVDDEVVTHNYQVDLGRFDDVWKVTQIVRVQQWEGVAGCALSSEDYPY